MGRRAKPKQGKAKANRASAHTPPKGDGAKVRDLERHLAEALEQQTATSEILRIISESPTDVRPVFDVIAAHACRLCDGVFANVVRFDGTLMHNMADDGFTAEEREVLHRAFPASPSRSSMSGRAILAASVVYVEDVTHALEFGVSREMGGLTGHRAMVSVPMLHNGAPVGAITVARLAVGRFAERHVNLLKTFAEQAVIAIENVRLFTETKEALEQQTATSDILRVISSSPTDVQPVFDAIARHTVALCDGVGSVVVRYDGAVMRLAAFHNVAPQSREVHETEYPRPPARTRPLGVAILDGTIVHVPNLQASARFAGSPVQRSGHASMIAVPLLRDGRAIGAIGISRSQPEGFSDRQIALLETFAAQAVIAVENVRLFTELQQKNEALATTHAQVSEALEQQTATADILRTISTSPSDVRPVLDAVVQAAARFCDAPNVMLARVDGAILRLVAGVGPFVEEAARRAGGLEQVAVPIDRSSVFGRCAVEKRTVHVADLAAEPEDEYPTGKALQSQFDHRTMMSTPLFRNGVPVGVIGLFRYEVRPFSEKQIGRLAAFAAQAVIAIENVRLFTELQTSNCELTTALDTQIATSNILRVISRAQTDVQPVFDAIVNSALQLLRGYSALVTRVAGDQIELAAYTSTGPDGDAVARATYPAPLDHSNAHGQTIRARKTLNIADAQTDARLPEASHAFARARGLHGLVVVPLLRHDEALGAIGVSRRELGAFTDDEIALLTTFADQAVIAIENVRLFTELQASNRDLTKALDTVGSSRVDLQACKLEYSIVSPK